MNELLAREPGTGRLLLKTFALALMLAGAAALTATVAFRALASASGWGRFIPAGIGALGVVALLAVLFGTYKVTVAALVRRPVRVARFESTGMRGRHHEVTLEDQSGMRHYYQVCNSQAGELATGDYGVAYTKGHLLVDFRRVRLEGGE